MDGVGMELPWFMYIVVTVQVYTPASSSVDALMLRITERESGAVMVIRFFLLLLDTSCSFLLHVKEMVVWDEWVAVQLRVMGCPL